MEIVPVTVGIPTWARGERVCATLERVLACDPPPAEIVVHVDASDGRLERELASRFPAARVLASPCRVSPGGGRHRCLLAATQPYFASFDDDSWPVDSDYFARVADLFATQPRIGLVSAVNVHPWETMVDAADDLEPVVEFAGCGFAIRRAAYLGVSGFVDRAWAYNAEEVDVALQLHAAGWQMVRFHRLRVFHDATLRHHESPAVTAAAIQNVALVAWLRYPVALWPRACLQVGNAAFARVRRGSWRGVFAGVFGILPVVWHFRGQRKCLSAEVVRDLWQRRRRPTLRVKKRPTGASRP